MEELVKQLIGRSAKVAPQASYVTAVPTEAEAPASWDDKPSENDGAAKEELQRKDNLFAKHLPDTIIFSDHLADLPYMMKHAGILMFLDISGFTALSEKYNESTQAGSDKLTTILNDYMGAMIEEILKINGDVLKFAGDAILVLWKLSSYSGLEKLVQDVIRCSVKIQRQYGIYHVDETALLKVKIALSFGTLYIHVFGSEKRRFYVESGDAIQDVKTAERLCESGDVLLSPFLWNFCNPSYYSYEYHKDKMHVKIKSCLETSMNRGAPSGDVALAAPEVRSRRRDSVATSRGDDIKGESEQICTSRAAVTEDIGVSNATLRQYITRAVTGKLDTGESDKLQSEIRPTSVMFVNVELSPTCTPEDQCNILHQSYQTMVDDLEKYSASLNKIFMFDKGCSFLVIFGLPGRKNAYDCQHAVQCAWAVINKLKVISMVSVVSVGVTTGYTFCGVVGHLYRHEYTVIGRKVNMAARLMMGYPGIVSCDNGTYANSRLRQHHFRDVPLVEMKGIKDIGVIREYTEDQSYICYVSPSLPTYSLPMLGRKQELRSFEDMLKNFTEGEPEDGLDAKHFGRILIYEGVSGCGLTRFMSAVTEKAKRYDDAKVVACSLTANDKNRSFYVARTFVSSLMNIVYEENKEEMREKVVRRLLMDNETKNVEEKISRLNTVLLLKTKYISKEDEEKKSADNEDLLSYLCLITSLATAGKTAVLVVDGGQFIDEESVAFVEMAVRLCRVLVVLGMAPLRLRVPGVETTAGIPKLVTVYNPPRTLLLPLEGDFIAPIACQILECTAIPVALDKLLRNKSERLPGHVEMILTDLKNKTFIKVTSLKQVKDRDENYVWPDIQLITGQDTTFSRKKSLLNARNKWAFEDSRNDGSTVKKLSEIEEKICILKPNVDLDYSKCHLPQSLKDGLLTQFDQLTQDEQLVLKCASTIGDTFYRRLLEEIYPLPPIKLMTSLELLFQRATIICFYSNELDSSHQVVQRRGSGCFCSTEERAKDEDETDTASVHADVGKGGAAVCQLFSFSSSLLRETIYDSLLEEQRRFFHYKIATFLEDRWLRLAPEEAAKFIMQDTFSAVDVMQIFKSARMELPNLDDTPDMQPRGGDLFAFMRIEGCVDWLKRKDEKSWIEILKEAAEGIMDSEGRRASNASTTSELRSSSHASFTKADIEALIKAYGEINPSSEKKRAWFATEIGATSSTSISPSGAPSSQELLHHVSLGINSYTAAAVNEASSEEDFRHRRLTRFSRRLTLLGNERLSVAPSTAVEDRDIDAETKTLILKQTIAHWKAAGHVVKTVLALIEVACFCTQQRRLNEVLKYLVVARSIIASVQSRMNPLTKATLPECSDHFLGAFWKYKEATVQLLLSQVFYFSGRMTEASSFSKECLSIMGLRVPSSHLPLGVSNIRLKCRSAVFRHLKNMNKSQQPSKQDIAAELQLTTCLSFMYQLTSTSTDYKKFYVNTEVYLADKSEDLQEQIIAYTNMINYGQNRGNRSRAENFIKIAEARNPLRRISELTADIGLPQLFFNVEASHFLLCIGKTSDCLDNGESALHILEVLKMPGAVEHVVPVMLHALFTKRSLSKDRQPLLTMLEQACKDPLTYYCCLWEEHLYTGCLDSESLCTISEFGENLFTKKMQQFRDCEDVTDADPRTALLEYDVMCSLLLSKLSSKAPLDQQTMENLLVVLDLNAPKRYQTYFEVHAFAKSVALTLLWLKEQLQTDGSASSISDRKTKLLQIDNMMSRLKKMCVSVPILEARRKRLIDSVNSFRLTGIIRWSLLPYAID